MSTTHHQLPRMYHASPELASPVLPNTPGGVAMQKSVSASSLETTTSMQTTCTTPNMSPDMDVVSDKPGAACNNSTANASQNPGHRLKIEYLLTPKKSPSDNFPDSNDATPEKMTASFSPMYTTQPISQPVADPAVIPASSEPRHAEYRSLFGAPSPQLMFQTAEHSEVLEAARILCTLAQDVSGAVLANSSCFTPKPKPKPKPKTKHASYQSGSLPALKPAYEATARISKKTNNTPAVSNATKGKNIASSAGSGNCLPTSPDKTPRTKRRAKSPQEGRNRTSAPSREDKDFQSVANYIPNVQLAPGEHLDVEWKAVPLDLSGDSFRHLLHEAELKLASSLRLDCATYLTSKRRIFVRCVECINSGKVFRKTDAQKACKIDVNKASKLWTAFDKAGWLKESLFTQYKK